MDDGPRRRRLRIPAAWRSAPRAALSHPLVAIVAGVTALLTCFLAAATSLHSSAAAGAAIEDRLDSVCQDQYGPVFTSPWIEPDHAQTVIDTVREHAPRHGFDAPIVSMFTPEGQAEFAGGEYSYRIGYRTDGIENLELLRGDASPGLWMGTELADDRNIPLGTRGGGGELPATTGIYRDLYLPAPDPWCSVQDLSMPNRLINIPTGPVLFATDRASFDAAHDVDELERLTITFREDPPETLPEAEDRLDRADALIAAVDDTLRRGGGGEITHGSTPFARSADLADQAQGNVGLSILPLAALAVAIGCAGLGVLGVQWYQRRYAQVRLHFSRGYRPSALGGLALAELGLPIVLGGLLGIVAARILLPVYGPPGTVDSGELGTATAAGAGALVTSAALVFAVVTIRTHREFQLRRLPGRADRRRFLAYVPWELGTAAFAFAGWLRLAEYGGASRSGDPLPQVDPLALTYPVAVVLTVGIVTARLAFLALRWSHRARFWTRPSLQLAIRRLAASRGPVVGVLVVTVLAVGTLAVGSQVSSSQRAALVDKTGMYVGAESAVDVEQAIGLGDEPVPEGARDGTSLVGRMNSTGTDPKVAVVDPDTFVDVAWTSRLEEDELRALLDRMAAPAGGTLPAIRVGAPGPVPEISDAPPLTPIAHLDAFPLLADDAGYVVSRDALTDEQLGAMTRWTLLSTGSLEALTAPFREAGLAHPNAETRSEVLDALPFHVVEWTFSFITLLGLVLAAVTVLALVVAVETRRRQNALAATLSTRMGMRRRQLLGSYLAELGAVGGIASIVGTVCGVIVAAIAVARFDPVRWLAPVADLPNPAPFVVAVVGACAFVVAATAWFAVRATRTAVPAELLRV
ncbi:hypothetical protein BJF85_15790 [Saccharomonospora sp. CUA-673]|uniref:FtsX-like permease family protein n=1 Tax=Saccharomonospora sp. CUA-673 TaxID=1904969 RepID=UPI0009597C45|nr:ABC transporter permease [Saccharomonospora sp. CUA-673]OLT46692.1 hypothetical protein BJF85_15790 [Saccharomonospora sp. CUA-673]